MCTLSWTCYMLQCKHTMLLLKGIKTNLWPLITREPGVWLKRKLVYSIGHTELYDISKNGQFFFLCPIRFLSKMFPSMMCTLSWNCYMLQCTHTMLLLKRYKNQPLTPYNSRTGCPIEAEVGVLYRAHIKTTNGKEKNIYKKNWSAEKQNKKRPLVTSKWPSKCSAIIVYYMYWVSCKSNNI